MASFSEQLQSAKAAHHAVSSLETGVRNRIAAAFDDWEHGVLDSQSVRHRLEAIVREAYRGASALAVIQAMTQSGLDKWRPSNKVFLTPYLTSLIDDVRRNLREYKASEQTDVDRRRAVSRIAHSAGVGAERGYTDSLIASYDELHDFGFQMRKVWMTSQDNNVPCEHCAALHGAEVALNSEFPWRGAPRKVHPVYGNLIGPPAHPNCRCYLAIILVSLDNAFETLDIQQPETPAPPMMTTDQVKSLPSKFFDAIVGALSKVVKFFRGQK